jgi:V/A-type H+-transporting ATPase subunit I
MIIADVGYSLVLGLVLLLFRKRVSGSGTGRRLLDLGYLLALFGTIYGVLVGSYFGVEPSPGSVLSWLRVLDLNDFKAMMRVSIVIGAGHLILAKLLSARRSLVRDGIVRSLSPLGWALVIGSALAYWLASDAGAAPRQLVYVGAFGALLVLALSSRRPWKASQLLPRLGDGLLALTGLTSAFGDVLSYLRLFALGLASASLAVTFNDLASSAEGLEGLGKLVALLTLVLGHGLNLVLALVSGVVHGLRLNVLEFFRWSDLGEGRPFIPFAKKELENDGHV